MPDERPIRPAYWLTDEEAWLQRLIGAAECQIRAATVFSEALEDYIKELYDFKARVNCVLKEHYAWRQRQAEQENPDAQR